MGGGLHEASEDASAGDPVVIPMRYIINWRANAALLTKNKTTAVL